MYVIHLQIDCSTGKEYSYPKLKKDVSAMAAAFQKYELGQGDVVMIMDYGSYEGQVVILAGILVGATVAALNYGLRESNSNIISYSILTIDVFRFVNDIISYIM